MPDWSYKTISQPLLFRLPPEQARDLTLGLIGQLARLPFGGQAIDFLGHMRADSRLETEVAGIHFPTSVGLGIGIDVNAVALPALERFGFGFLEIGPVTKEPIRGTAVELNPDEQTITYSKPPTLGITSLTSRLHEWGERAIPYMVRLTCSDGSTIEDATAECCHCIEQLAPYTDIFSLSTIEYVIYGDWPESAWLEHLTEIIDALQVAGHNLLICIPANIEFDAVAHLIQQAQALGIIGVIVQGRVEAENLQAGESRYQMGPNNMDTALPLVQALREQWGTSFAIVASGGIHEPAQALAMMEAGADLIQVDSGLVHSGPGLPKRINEAILYNQCHQNQPEPGRFSNRQSDSENQLCPNPITDGSAQYTEQTWFWTYLLAIAMLIGGMMALLIAIFGVVLPYDEQFVGMTRTELAAINDRLLPFMAHDRITLAGTMLALGFFYLTHSIYGIRRGIHWARVTVLYSASAGFVSFFLFLGFGYFDPFHAFVTAILFQLLLMGLHTRLSPYVDITSPSLHNDRAWRMGLWSQLFFILQGIAIIGAGIVIATIGITVVFVAEDLEFMQTTAEALWGANPRLVPLVAHDRATLGGMLISSGITIFLSALWGYRPGERWQWWSLLIGCSVAYLATLAVHLRVGYVDLLHLSPVFAGLALTAVASWLSYAYLFEAKEL